MAWRPNYSIIRGEVDNRERGRVTGKLWIVGRDAPVTLDLIGDAWPDIAGCQISFTNPEARAEPEWSELAAVQRGQVGDITASLTRKSFTVPEVEWMEALHQDRIADVPCVMKKALYIEWYSEANGRVVIEGTQFEVTVSERAWEPDEDEHQAQQMLNMQAMRDYLETIIQRPEEAAEDLKWPDDMSEAEWEEQLKRSDRLTDAALEAFEKFQDDPDSHKKEAFVMGWDHMLEDDEEEDEFDLPESFGDSDTDPSENNCPEADGAEDWSNWPIHPLQQKAQDYGVAASNCLDELGIGDEEKREGAASRFLGSAIQIMAKLAGALNTHPEDPQPTGYVLAITKRCLNWANDALAALEELTRQRPEAREKLTQLRAGLFEIRDGITDLRRELRGEGP